MWKVLSVLIGAEALQVSNLNGCLQYPAVQVTHRGNKLSYTAGIYEIAERRPEGADPVLNVDDGHFRMTPHLKCRTIQHYLPLYTLAASMEQGYKERLARGAVEEYRKIGRRSAGRTG